MRAEGERLTVKPRGKISSSAVLPRVSLMKLSKHSAQKSSLPSVKQQRGRTISAHLPAFVPRSIGTWSG
jgi:hypothetical protein